MFLYVKRGIGRLRGLLGVGCSQLVWFSRLLEAWEKVVTDDRSRHSCGLRFYGTAFVCRNRAHEFKGCDAKDYGNRRRQEGQRIFELLILWICEWDASALR